MTPVSRSLPPMGVRVSARLTTGHTVEVQRRPMPRGGWAWGSPYRPVNFAQEDVTAWAYHEQTGRRA